MLNRKLKQLREIQDRRANGEKGFTLIELLVVIIIIGILASIAIPIFMNQQKTARDAATTSDVKNIATTLQTGLVKYPDAVYFGIEDAAPRSSTTAPDEVATGEWVKDDNGDGKLTVYVGNSTINRAWEAYEVTVSKGTTIRVNNAGIPGQFEVHGANPNGKSYTEVDTPGKELLYSSANGGLR